MGAFKCLVSTAIAGSLLALAVLPVEAQVSVTIGVAPECPYGYYDADPYGCAPPGYYGPEWFAGGVFIGAGPWFHGRHNFRGHVNNTFHPDHGYQGPMPNRGERPEPSKRVDRAHFSGNEVRDGRGHAVEGRR